MKGQLRINQMLAFMVLDDDGTEGVCAIRTAEGYWLPLMGADMARVDSLKELVQAEPMFAGRKVTILRFGHREEVGVIDRSQEVRA